MNTSKFLIVTFLLTSLISFTQNENQNNVSAISNLRMKSVNDSLKNNELVSKKIKRQTNANKKKMLIDSLTIVLPKEKIKKDTIDYYEKFSINLIQTKEERIAFVEQRKKITDSINNLKIEQIRSKKNNQKQIVPIEEINIDKQEVINKQLKQPKQADDVIVEDSITVKNTVLVTDADFNKVFDEGRRILEEEKDNEKALEFFNECIKRKYYDVSAIYYKGITLRNMKRYDDAIDAFRDLFSLDGTFYIVYFEIGKIHIERKEFDYALFNFNQYGKQNPHSHENHYYKAFIYFETKKDKMALEEINKAIKINDNSSDYHMLAGKIRLSLKSTPAACLDFQKAVDLKNIEALKYLNEHCVKK